MKKFEFNLETILRVRTKYEDRVKEEFNDQLRRVAEQKKVILQLVEERAQIEAAVKSDGKKQINIERHCSYNNYLQLLKEKVKLAKEELGLLETELEKCRVVLVKAQKDVKILEKLREHRVEDYRKILNREEQIFLDEISMTRSKG